MQASLKARKDDELALISGKDQTHAEQVSRRQRIEAEIEAFRSTFTTALANTDRMTGTLTETAETLASIARAAGRQSTEAASTADQTSANVQMVATAAGQLGESVQGVKSKVQDAVAIVQRLRYIRSVQGRAKSIAEFHRTGTSRMPARPVLGDGIPRPTVMMWSSQLLAWVKDGSFPA